MQTLAIILIAVDSVVNYLKSSTAQTVILGNFTAVVVVESNESSPEHSELLLSVMSNII